jgi:hypothetical protein
MIGHKLPNKTKSATVAEPKFFHQLNNPLVVDVSLLSSEHRTLAYSNPDLAGCQTAYVQVLMVVTHERT